ncbi:MAG TPA: HAMP domain-containing sensor histidine kinase [Candidatus Acidoferrales bacterium]|nr:HAMP domain-containing sensor histidine kinase [Candidatus Acidoferrales bacterium]
MGEPTAPELVVVIDDDYAIRLSCAKILAKMGFRAEAFEDGALGLDGVARLKPDMVIVDLKMPGLSGMEVIPRVHEIDPRTVIVVITGYATIDTAVQAMKSGAYDFLPKPFSPEELRLIVNRGLERRRLAIEAERHEIEQTMLKRRFVTFVSHQLRTPLVAIHQYLDVLQHLDEAKDSPARRQEWLARCLARIEELQALISDWLTLARVEGGSLFKERIKVDLNSIVPPILKTYEQTAAAEGVLLEARLPDGDLNVWGDRNCLTVLFDNLITNAIKYNRAGGRVTVTGSQSRGEVEISVADTGMGIPEKYRPFLFDEFFRVKDEGTRKTTGTGLGLHICKRIVAEMGGAIEVASEVGAGSTFSVRLPAWQEPGGTNGSQDNARREESVDCRR